MDVVAALFERTSGGARFYRQLLRPRESEERVSRFLAAVTRETKKRPDTDDSYLLELIFGDRRRHSEEVVQLRVDNVSHGAAVDAVPAGRRADKESEPVVLEAALLVSCRFPV